VIEAKSVIPVPPDMTIFLGEGSVDASQAPQAPSLWLGFAPDGQPGAVLHINPDSRGSEELGLVLLVTRRAIERLFGEDAVRTGSFHLPSELKAMLVAIQDCRLPGSARDTLRGAKAIELLCGVFERLGAGSLLPAEGGAFTERDTQRLILARQMIEERWSEKLTLDAIARACGLNRAKLTRGFRDLFDCTIGDALSEQRLGGARQMLLATDLPVSSIGYRCGYLNNASFTRAFSRRYGVAPTQLRARGTMQWSATA
jgi:AraC family transcriptional activator of pyochelin receptor